MHDTLPARQTCTKTHVTATRRLGVARYPVLSLHSHHRLDRDRRGLYLMLVATGRAVAGARPHTRFFANALKGVSTTTNTARITRGRMSSTVAVPLADTEGAASRSQR